MINIASKCGSGVLVAVQSSKLKDLVLVFISVLNELCFYLSLNAVSVMDAMFVFSSLTQFLL